jgi:hypothetical protein
MGREEMGNRLDCIEGNVTERNWVHSDHSLVKFKLRDHLFVSGSRLRPSFQCHDVFVKVGVTLQRNVITEFLD